MDELIIWPKLNEEINIHVERFNKLRGRDSFPNVIGCIDGMHVPISAPLSDSSSYYNRKGFYSLILQAVCDARGVFINAFFGWPGRSHDAFKKSFLGRNLENGTINTDVHIVGDSAYPLASYLMVPFKDNGSLTERQQNFNRRLSSTRVLIEQSFGIMKAKFRILNHIKLKKISEICCHGMHNFTQLHNFIGRKFGS